MLKGNLMKNVCDSLNLNRRLGHKLKNLNILQTDITQYFNKNSSF